MKVDRKIEFPTEVKEIKIKHLITYAKYSEKQKGSAFDMLKIFAGDLAGYVDTAEGLEIGNQLTSLFQRSVNLVQTFKWKGIEYGFIPNLENITMGEYSDIATLEEQGMWDNMHRMLTIFYRPIVDQVGNDYQIQNYNGIDERLALAWREELNGDVVVGSLGFFLLLRQDCENNFLQYSPKKPWKIRTTPLRLTSYLVMACIIAFCFWLMGNFWTLLESLTATLWNAFSS